MIPDSAVKVKQLISLTNVVPYSKVIAYDKS